MFCLLVSVCFWFFLLHDYRMTSTAGDESSYLSSTSDTFLLAADSPADKMKQMRSFCKIQAYSCHSSCSYTQLVVIHTAATMQIVLIHPEDTVHVDSSHSCCSYLQIVVIYPATKNRQLPYIPFVLQLHVDIAIHLQLHVCSQLSLILQLQAAGCHAYCSCYVDSCHLYGSFTHNCHSSCRNMQIAFSHPAATRRQLLFILPLHTDIADSWHSFCSYIQIVFVLSTIHLQIVFISVLDPDQHLFEFSRSKSIVIFNS